MGGPGHFTLEPADRWHVRGGSYDDGTLTWTSRWVDADRVVECRNALATPASPAASSCCAGHGPSAVTRCCGWAGRAPRLRRAPAAGPRLEDGCGPPRAAG
ncbi:hypothetical protein [Streptomyces sp. C8S0]|uniref:hypothetical protein n=1 Tax=Streptomyces sp. C8S0 TaxID=2585716 RepID=UPI001D05A17A|nr:hypothetical protein [Streptomyces sp. C8S0]